MAVDRKNQAVMQEIECDSMVSAIDKFKEINNLEPSKCSGPYFKKRGWDHKSENKITFTKEVRMAIYNEWYVKANILSNPPNTAFIFFNKRIDGKIIKPPPGEIVNLGDLKLK